MHPEIFVWPLPVSLPPTAVDTWNEQSALGVPLPSGAQGEAGAVGTSPDLPYLPYPKYSSVPGRMEMEVALCILNLPLVIHNSDAAALNNKPVQPS